MPVVETLPPLILPQPTEMLPMPGMEQGPGPSPQQIEGIGIVAVSEALDTTVSLEEELAMLDAVSNGVDVRAEDAGRVHDPNAAYLEALQEDEILKAHTEALAQNEAFDAQRAEENRAKDENEKDDDEDTSEEQPPQEAKGPEAVPADMPAVELDLRGQAEAALKNAGFSEPIPLDSRVQTDPLTGQLLVINPNSHSVKLLTPQLGGSMQLTEYSYDKNDNIVTINDHGGRVIRMHGGYVPVEGQGAVSRNVQVTVLPRSVARAIGVNSVTPFAPTS